MSNETHNTHVNVRAKITLHFYGGLIVTIVLLFGLALLAITVTGPFVKALIIVLLSLAVIAGIFVVLEVTQKVIRIRGESRKTLVVHADEHRLVLMEGGLFTKKPVVYETNNARYTYNIKQVEDRNAIDAEEQKLLEPPKPRLPEVVRYEDIKRDIPAGHALVGISERGIETKEEDRIKPLIWIVGGTGVGKTNTTVLRVDEDYEHNYWFYGIDPHAFKEDSLTNAVQGYTDRFLMPMAQRPEDILYVIEQFLGEFKRRKAGGRWKKRIRLLADEVGSLTTDIDETNELEVKIARGMKEVARICGHESRGFEMGGALISQDAAGLAWLRKRASMVLGHQVLMWSERLLVCNQNTEIARNMDTWPIGRTVIYGLAFTEGVRVFQQPLFSRPLRQTVEADYQPPLSSVPSSNQEEKHTDPQVTLDDALAAWQNGATSVRKLMAELDLTYYRANILYQQIKAKQLID